MTKNHSIKEIPVCKAPSATNEVYIDYPTAINMEKGELPNNNNSGFYMCMRKIFCCSAFKSAKQSK